MPECHLTYSVESAVDGYPFKLSATLKGLIGNLFNRSGDNYLRDLIIVLEGRVINSDHGHTVFCHRNDNLFVKAASHTSYYVAIIILGHSKANARLAGNVAVFALAVYELVVHKNYFLRNEDRITLDAIAALGFAHRGAGGLYAGEDLNIVSMFQLGDRFYILKAAFGANTHPFACRILGGLGYNAPIAKDVNVVIFGNCFLILKAAFGANSHHFACGILGGILYDDPVAKGVRATSIVLLLVISVAISAATHDAVTVIILAKSV